jgi:hypothetical protein
MRCFVALLIIMASITAADAAGSSLLRLCQHRGGASQRLHSRQATFWAVAVGAAIAIPRRTYAGDRLTFEGRPPQLAASSFPVLAPFHLDWSLSPLKPMTQVTAAYIRERRS